MFTAESLRTKYLKGFPIREWHSLRPRNEAFDCRVYALAALKILNPNIARLVKALEVEDEEIEIPVEAEPQNEPEEKEPEVTPPKKPQATGKRVWKPKSKRRRRGI
ncbi:MAG: phage terminase large subunit GpA-like protein [Pseudophaeobacter arcticus]|jgi:phage terminase large subunit GpA-like protein